MTYNVFGGTLNLTQSINLLTLSRVCISELGTVLAVSGSV